MLITAVTSERSPWSGSYLDQLEQQSYNVWADEDVDMDAEEMAYVARHQEIEAPEEAPGVQLPVSC